MEFLVVAEHVIVVLVSQHYARASSVHVGEPFIDSNESIENLKAPLAITQVHQLPTNANLDNHLIGDCRIILVL